MLDLLTKLASTLHPHARVQTERHSHCTTHRISLGGRRVISVHFADWPAMVEQHHVDPTHGTTYSVAKMDLEKFLTELLASAETQSLIEYQSDILAAEEAKQKAKQQAEQK